MTRKNRKSEQADKSEGRHKITLKSVFEQHGFIIFLMVFFTVSMQYAIIMLTARNYGLGRYIFPLFPLIALMFVAIAYFLLSSLNKKIAVVIITAACILFTLTNYDRRNVSIAFTQIPDIPHL